MIGSALLRDQITVEPFGGDTATGPVYGPAVTYPARIAPTARMVRTPTGEDRQVAAVAVVRPDANVTTRSLVVYDGTTYVVLTVARRMQLTRCVYQELSLGWAD
jgi:hypothetical protein